MAINESAKLEVTTSPSVPNSTTDDLPEEGNPVEVLVLGTGLYLVKVKNGTKTEHCFNVPSADQKAQMGEKAATFSNSLAKLIEVTYPHKSEA
jgi:hypothetical protein